MGVIIGWLVPSERAGGCPTWQAAVRRVRFSRGLWLPDEQLLHWEVWRSSKLKGSTEQCLDWDWKCRVNMRDRRLQCGLQVTDVCMYLPGAVYSRASGGVSAGWLSPQTDHHSMAKAGRRLAAQRMWCPRHVLQQ